MYWHRFFYLLFINQYEQLLFIVLSHSLLNDNLEIVSMSSD